MKAVKKLFRGGEKNVSIWLFFLDFWAEEGLAEADCFPLKSLGKAFASFKCWINRETLKRPLNFFKKKSLISRAISPLGRGFYGSLRRQVGHEIRQLGRRNHTLRQARYSRPKRLLRKAFVGRSVGQFILFYAVILAANLAGSWVNGKYFQKLLPSPPCEFDANFLLNVACYLVAGQIGILAIVSVAVGVVTLLSDCYDGASVNTDIRLYYVESYAYELSVSGVSLLLVVIIQLFWPFHHLLKLVTVGSDDWFKISLCAFHAIWFCANLFLFLQFITTTLRFAEPHRREALRERYSANEVIPFDVGMRMLRQFYAHIPNQLFGADALKGPSITCGHAPSTRVTQVLETEKTFRRPSKLQDVRLTLLSWAIRRWQRRVRSRPPHRDLFGQCQWDDELLIVPNFDRVMHGQCSLVVRTGEVPFTRFEKYVLRRSFRFAPARPDRDNAMPKISHFLEQLVDKLVRQIELGSTTGFRSAFDEAVTYHRFVLDAQNTKDGAGNSINLAEISDTILDQTPTGFVITDGHSLQHPKKSLVTHILLSI